MNEQGTLPADADQAQPEGESDRTELSELESLLPALESEQEAQPEAEKPADDAETEPEVPAFTDETEVELDGRKVSVREMKETFQTFSRKSQEMAEKQRETVSMAREAVARFAEQKAQEIQLLEQSIEGLVAPGISEAKLMELAATNPMEFYQVKARLDMARDLKQRLQAQAAQLSHTAQQERDIAQREAADAHQKLLQEEGARLSGQKWYTPDFKAKAVAFARKHGIPQQAAESVAYAGFVEITRKAMLYDEAMSKTKGGKQVPTQPTTTPGATAARGQVNQQKAVADTFSRAKQSRSRSDIGAWLDKVL